MLCGERGQISTQIPGYREPISAEKNPSRIHIELPVRLVNESTFIG